MASTSKLPLYHRSLELKRREMGHGSVDESLNPQLFLCSTTCFFPCCGLLRLVDGALLSIFVSPRSEIFHVNMRLFHYSVIFLLARSPFWLGFWLIFRLRVWIFLANCIDSLFQFVQFPCCTTLGPCVGIGIHFFRLLFTFWISFSIFSSRALVMVRPQSLVDWIAIAIQSAVDSSTIWHSILTVSSRL